MNALTIKLQASEFSTRRKGSLDEIESKEQESIDSLATTSNGRSYRDCTKLSFPGQVIEPSRKKNEVSIQGDHTTRTL